MKQVSKFHCNGKLIDTTSTSLSPVILGSDEVVNSSLIIGQEPDIMDGEFDISQLFNGEMS